MASCAKCGRSKIKKRKDGTKKCRKCGYLPGYAPEDVLRKMLPENPYGCCFDAAAHNLLHNIDCETLVMCHGIGISNHPDEAGQRITHAWLEFDHPKGRAAFDPIWLVMQSAKVYRENFKVELVIEYPKAEFIRLWHQHDFPGPWDERLTSIMGKKEIAA